MGKNCSSRVGIEPKNTVYKCLNKNWAYRYRPSQPGYRPSPGADNPTPHLLSPFWTLSGYKHL